MRRDAPRVAAVVLAVGLALAGCASGTPEQDAAPEGPNGYTLSASFDDGSMLWWDGGDESGLTDLILEDEGGRMFASCLGRGPLLCVGGTDEARGALVIGPAGAERAVMHWYGTDVELVRGEQTPDDAPPVFAGVMPPVGAEGSYSVEVFDAAGAVVMTQ
ncbi:hypothetical protein ABIB37_001692 [Agrococcus sp. UYP10]|uniref:hypothetical protein n=1 Tax=Agrococcus sp. UYP10 TaxID=1756355 RepID=UPI003398947D